MLAQKSVFFTPLNDSIDSITTYSANPVENYEFTFYVKFNNAHSNSYNATVQPDGTLLVNTHDQQSKEKLLNGLKKLFHNWKRKLEFQIISGMSAYNLRLTNSIEETYFFLKVVLGCSVLDIAKSFKKKIVDPQFFLNFLANELAKLHLSLTMNTEKDQNHQHEYLFQLNAQNTEAESLIARLQRETIEKSIEDFAGKACYATINIIDGKILQLIYRFYMLFGNDVPENVHNEHISTFAFVIFALVEDQITTFNAKQAWEANSLTSKQFWKFRNFTSLKLDIFKQVNCEYQAAKVQVKILSYEGQTFRFTLQLNNGLLQATSTANPSDLNYLKIILANYHAYGLEEPNSIKFKNDEILQVSYHVAYSYRFLRVFLGRPFGEVYDFFYQNIGHNKKLVIELIQKEMEFQNLCTIDLLNPNSPNTSIIASTPESTILKITLHGEQPRLEQILTEKNGAHYLVTTKKIKTETAHFDKMMEDDTQNNNNNHDDIASEIIYEYEFKKPWGNVDNRDDKIAELLTRIFTASQTAETELTEATIMQMN